MALEYILLLVLSAMFIFGSFSGTKGPVNMFAKATPFLAHRVEAYTMTGYGFFSVENGHGRPVGWRR